MSKIYALLLLLVATIHATGQNRDEDKLKSIEASRGSFVARKSTNELDKLYPDSFHVVTATGSIVTKKDILDLYEECHPGNTNVRPEKIEARVFNDRAIVNGWLVTRTVTGKLVRESPFMHFYHKINGEWMIVAGRERRKSD